MDSGKARELFKAYAAAAAYIEVELPNGDRHIGSAFHVGDGVFVTARHVVENNKILEICSTESTYIRLSDGDAEKARIFMVENDQRIPIRDIANGIMRLKSGPYFHHDERVDVAVFEVAEIDPDTPVVPLGSHLDDWLGSSDFVLTEAIVLGYPPIPMATGPVLVGARAEVNAQIDLYDTPNVHFILSSMPRGGFSGSVALSEYGMALGVVTRSLTADNSPTELGFMTVAGIEPIYDCLASHKLLPDIQAEGWDGLWNSTDLHFYDPKTNGPGPGFLGVAGITVFDDGKKYAITVMCDVSQDLMTRALAAVNDELAGRHLAYFKIRDGMQRVDIYGSGDQIDVEVTAAAQAVSRIFLESGLAPIPFEGTKWLPPDWKGENTRATDVSTD
jgi:hypothetical protein